MAVETVRVYTTDQSGDPLAGVLVRFYDGAGALVTQQYTSLVGVEAYAEVGLDGAAAPAPTPYTVRLSKNGVAFDGSLGDDSKTPQSIGVYSPPAGAPTGTNYFAVQGTTFIRPVATDPRLCRCSGFFKDPLGRPLVGMALHLSQYCPNDDQAPFTPLIVDGDGILGDKVLLRTDALGYVVVDLYRTGTYFMYMPGLGSQWRSLHIPDLPSMNLINLIFPVITSIVFDPDPLAMSVGDTTEIDVTVTASDGRVLDPLNQDLLFTSSDESVVGVEVLADSKLSITALAAGTAQIEAAVTDTGIVTIPEEPITYAPLDITVA